MLRTLPALFRLARAGFVMAREGVFSGVEVELTPPPAHLPLRIANLIARRQSEETTRAHRISNALERLGPSYIKLGQFLATRPDLVGMAVARDLETLQDSLPSMPLDKAEARIEEALGRPVGDMFESIEPALAAASIAQVHKAVTLDPHTGARAEVAVKVLRPGVEARFARDLHTFYIAARLLERMVSKLRRLRPVAVVDTLAESVRLEMDLRMEAAALAEMADNVKADQGFRVPSVDWDRSGAQVLTIEWIDGRKLSDVDGIRADGHDLQKLGATIIQSFLRHAMRDGFFHADMHPGNLFIEPDGTLVAVDLGITGRLGLAERRFLAEILFGFITRNYRRTAEVHFEAGYVPAHHDVDSFAQALRAIGEPIHGRNASQISMGRLLTQLFEVTDLFDMRTQPQLIMLQKTMVVVEGVARTLDPNLDIWKTSDPVVSEWIRGNLSPIKQAEEVAKSAVTAARLISDAPDMMMKLQRIANAYDPEAPGASSDKNQSPVWLWPTALVASAVVIGVALVVA
ncbi:MAG: 2-polyprenylphenol 6-hydroxylase [Devosiaceae bacterium]|nr:2-polyprenylphenol 6-hydroxylase [Devosiaceae bacterium MH13]